MLDPQLIAQIVGPLSGAIVAICSTIYGLRSLQYQRERLAAIAAAKTPEQRAQVEALPAAPTAGGPASIALLLLLSGGMAIGSPIAAGWAHPVATMEQLLQDKPPACTKQTCPPPAQCTFNGCQGNARPANPLESQIGLEGEQIGEPTVYAQLPGWVHRR